MHNIRNRPLWQLQTEKVKITLHGCTAWSGSSVILRVGNECPNRMCKLIWAFIIGISDHLSLHFISARIWLCSTNKYWFFFLHISPCGTSNMYPCFHGEIKKENLSRTSMQSLYSCNPFVLRFYGPVNPMGSCRARSVYLTTRLLGRLCPLSG